MTEVTTTTIVITTKANSNGNNYRSDRPSIESAFLKQMPVSELAVMVQGFR